MKGAEVSRIDAARQVNEAIRSLLARKGSPVVVALDGGSGAGKSTLAHSVRETFGGVIVPLDDFFSAQIPDHQWEAFTEGHRNQPGRNPYTRESR